MRDFIDWIESIYFSFNLWLAQIEQETEFWLVIIIFVSLLGGIAWKYFL